MRLRPHFLLMTKNTTNKFNNYDGSIEIYLGNYNFTLQ